MMDVLNDIIKILSQSSLPLSPKLEAALSNIFYSTIPTSSLFENTQEENDPNCTDEFIVCYVGGLILKLVLNFRSSGPPLDVTLSSHFLNQIIFLLEIRDTVIPSILTLFTDKSICERLNEALKKLPMDTTQSLYVHKTAVDVLELENCTLQNLLDEFFSVCAYISDKGFKVIGLFLKFNDSVVYDSISVALPTFISSNLCELTRFCLPDEVIHFMSDLKLIPERLLGPFLAFCHSMLGYFQICNENVNNTPFKIMSLDAKFMGAIIDVLLHFLREFKIKAVNFFVTQESRTKRFLKLQSFIARYSYPLLMDDWTCSYNSEMFNVGHLFLRYELPEEVLAAFISEIVEEIGGYVKELSSPPYPHNFLLVLPFRYLPLLLQNAHRFCKNVKINYDPEKVLTIIKLVHGCHFSKCTCGMTFRKDLIFHSDVFHLKFAVENCPGVDFVTEVLTIFEVDLKSFLKDSSSPLSFKNVLLSLCFLAHVLVHDRRIDVFDEEYFLKRYIIMCIINRCPEYLTYSQIREFVARDNILFDGLQFDRLLEELSHRDPVYYDEKTNIIHPAYYKLAGQSWTEHFEKVYFYYRAITSNILIDDYFTATRERYKLLTGTEIWYPISFSPDPPQYFPFSPSLFSFLLSILIMIDCEIIPNDADIYLQLVVHILYYSAYVYLHMTSIRDDGSSDEFLIPFSDYYMGVTTLVEFNSAQYSILLLILKHYAYRSGDVGNISPEMPICEVPKTGEALKYLGRLLNAIDYILQRNGQSVSDFCPISFRNESKQKNYDEKSKIFKEFRERRLKRLSEVTPLGQSRRTKNSEKSCVMCHLHGNQPGDNFCHLYKVKHYNVLGCTHLDKNTLVSHKLPAIIDMMYKNYPSYFVNMTINLAACDGLLLTCCDHLIHRKCIERYRKENNKLHCPLCGTDVDFTLPFVESRQSITEDVFMDEKHVRTCIENSSNFPPKGKCKNMLTFLELIERVMPLKSFPITFPFAEGSVSCVFSSVLRQNLENKLFFLIYGNKYENLTAIKPLDSFLNFWNFISTTQNNYVKMEHILEIYDSLTIDPTKIGFPIGISDPVSLFIMFSLAIPLHSFKAAFPTLVKICSQLAIHQDKLNSEHVNFMEDDYPISLENHSFIHFILIVAILHRSLFDSDIPRVQESHEYISLDSPNSQFIDFCLDLIGYHKCDLNVDFSSLSDYFNTFRDSCEYKTYYYNCITPRPMLANLSSEYTVSSIDSYCLLCGKNIGYTEIDKFHEHFNYCGRGTGLIFHENAVVYYHENANFCFCGGLFFNKYGESFDPELENFNIDMNTEYTLNLTIFKTLERKWRQGVLRQLFD